MERERMIACDMWDLLCMFVTTCAAIDAIVQRCCARCQGGCQTFNCYLADKMRYSVRPQRSPQSVRPPTDVGAALRDTPADAFRDRSPPLRRGGPRRDKKDVVPGLAGVPASRRLLRRMSKRRDSESDASHKEHPDVQKLLDAALAYDEGAVVTVVRRIARVMGWGDALDEVLFPALVKVGAYWGDNQVISANEHFATELVRREIAHAIAGTAEPASSAPSIVLACPRMSGMRSGFWVSACFFGSGGSGTTTSAPMFHSST